jgi:hypothetical protein
VAVHLSGNKLLTFADACTPAIARATTPREGRAPVAGL